MQSKLKFLVALSALSLVNAVSAADDQSTHQATSERSAKKPSFESSATATATATVDSVDQKKRTVTFHTPEGELETVAVGDNVKNLDQVKPGDNLTIHYYEYTRVKVYPAGATIPKSAAESGTASAAKGEKPAGSEAAHVTQHATVEKLDKKTGKVTLKGESGETRTITARNKANLKNVEVGDQVVLTREKAIAASVQSAPKD